MHNELRLSWIAPTSINEIGILNKLSARMRYFHFNRSTVMHLAIQDITLWNWDISIVPIMMHEWLFHVLSHLQMWSCMRYRCFLLITHTHVEVETCILTYAVCFVIETYIETYISCHLNHTYWCSHICSMLCVWDISIATFKWYSLIMMNDFFHVHIVISVRVVTSTYTFGLFRLLARIGEIARWFLHL